jgi:hypothetical protein
MPAKRQDTLKERLARARKARKLPAKAGHEVSADGKEVRTPTAGEFFGNLGKASKPQK